LYDSINFFLPVFPLILRLYIYVPIFLNKPLNVFAIKPILVITPNGGAYAK